MANRYTITLTQSEREELTQLTRTGKTNARKFAHARALLLCDAGEFGQHWKVADAADALGLSTRTIEHIKERFVEEGIEAAIERRAPIQPRKPTFDAVFEAHLFKLACSPAPAGFARWTLGLLADRLVELKIVDEVSVMTVQRRLKKTRFAPT
jgi:hypothetical protein